ncbi:MAG: PEP-CTERM sorting domain-containing protein, partial [Bryobacteraceae bacterium]
LCRPVIMEPMKSLRRRFMSKRILRLLTTIPILALCSNAETVSWSSPSTGSASLSYYSSPRLSVDLAKTYGNIGLGSRSYIGFDSTSTPTYSTFGMTSTLSGIYSARKSQLTRPAFKSELWSLSSQLIDNWSGTHVTWNSSPSLLVPTALHATAFKQVNTLSLNYADMNRHITVPSLRNYSLLGSVTISPTRDPSLLLAGGISPSANVSGYLNAVANRNHQSSNSYLYSTPEPGTYALMGGGLLLLLGLSRRYHRT